MNRVTYQFREALKNLSFLAKGVERNEGTDSIVLHCLGVEEFPYSNMLLYPTDLLWTAH